MTTHAATSRPTDGDDDGPDAVRSGIPAPAAPPSSGPTPSVPTLSGPAASTLSERAAEARARLEPDVPAIPAPRTPSGVTLPVSLRPRDGAPAPDLLAAADALVAELAALDGTPDDPSLRAVARLSALTATGVPEGGWSAAEGLPVATLVAARTRADDLRASTTALLERLDAEGHSSAAAVVDGLAASLRVVVMVADLEVFGRGG